MRLSSETVTRNMAVAGLFLAMLATYPAAAESIQLQQSGGVFMVPVRINDAITIPFILDSGASVVVIPADVFSTLQRTGTISQSDFIGPGKYTIADGSTLSSDFYVIHKMAVGTRVITDVIASVVSAKGNPLLGQSFLSKIPGWAIDNARHVLVLDDGTGATGGEIPPTASSNGRTVSIKTFSNGDRYEGEWRDGKMNGRGVFTSSNGDRYEGEFRDDVINGRGVLTFSNGDRYEGEWRDGKMNGRGVLTFASARVRELHRDAGRPPGAGDRDDPYAGDRYDGEWRDGKRHGRGVYTSGANGDRYEGEFRDDNMNGHGVDTEVNGDRYEGEFLNGKMNGRGVLIIRGTRYKVEFRDGRLLHETAR